MACSIRRVIPMPFLGEQTQALEEKRDCPKPGIPLNCPNEDGLFCHQAWDGIAGRLSLSSRQIEVARHVLHDDCDDVIASKLGLKRGTVHTHVERLHKKLGVHSRVQLAMQIFATYLVWRIESTPPTDCPLRSRLESP